MHVVLYDGRCGLCNGIVRFLLKIDRGERLVFAPLQGETAQSLSSLWKHRDETIILVSSRGTDNENVLEKSDAVLQIFNLLGGVWRVLTIMKVFPRALRDRVYDWIARNRTGWFGSHDYESCPIPDGRYRSRFFL